VLVAAAAVFVAMGSGFTAKVIVEGRKASQAMKRLSTSAPVFAARAEELLRNGDFREALEAADNAVDLDARVAEYHVVRGNALQVLMRLGEAREAYRRAEALGGDEVAGVGVKLTEEVMDKIAKEGDLKGKLALYEGLNRVGRQMEALAFGRDFEEFWDVRAERTRDRSVIPELIKRLEAKMLPVPGTEILLSKTEFTVGEWKLYLRAEGYPEWRQPEPREFVQNDDHPVVKVSWNDTVKFCDWLSSVSGKKWRLPTDKEWDAAVGKTKYPWGDYFPPKRDDGNYSIQSNGKGDPTKVGFDGVKGTAAVGMFRPNELGIHDLGGNVSEWILDGYDVTNPSAYRKIRGGSWHIVGHQPRSSLSDETGYPHSRYSYTGFRLACSLGQ
jgi:formylglycine-generating enzyme required for sulfatase activity